MNIEEINYKELYLTRTKELYALKISINPYWDGDDNNFELVENYTLAELEDIWFQLVEAEHEDSYNTNY